MANELDSSYQLGLTLFYKRGEGDRGTVSKLVPIIARQLATQFAKLIAESFAKYESSRIIISIIDTLDECDHKENMKLLINIFSWSTPGDPVRILLTSRPELPIRLGFGTLLTESYDNVILQQIPTHIIKHDLGLYLQYRFDSITSEDNDLPLEWLGADNLKALVELAFSLFIFAATICRFVADPLWTPQQQLDYLLEHKQVNSDALNRAYAPVLVRLLQTITIQQVNIIDDFKAIVGPIVTVAEPLSVKTFASLLDIP